MGAALLVPAGGLTVLGVGTVGATTSSLVTTSTATLGSLGSMTMSGIALFPTTSTGTIQKNLTTQLLPIGSKLKIKLTASLLIKVATTPKKITAVSIKVSAHGLLTTGVSPTTVFNGCSVTGLPKITYSKTSALVWKATTVSLSSVTVGGSCTTKTMLTSDIHGHTLASKLTFSAA